MASSKTGILLPNIIYSKFYPPVHCTAMYLFTLGWNSGFNLKLILFSKKIVLKEIKALFQNERKRTNAFYPCLSISLNA